MNGPAWLSDTFAALMLLIAVYCAGRLAAGAIKRRETELDADLVHLLMGTAMAGMLAPSLSFLAAGVWEAVFAIAAAWFAWQTVRVVRGSAVGAWRCAFPAPHLAESLAMVYAFAAVRSVTGGASGGMAMSGAGRFPVLAMVFALFMVGYIAWLGDRFTSISPRATAAAQCWPILAPRSAACYKITMGVSMAYMLVIML